MVEMNLSEKEAWSFWLGCTTDDFDGFQLHSNPRFNESDQIIVLVSKHGFNVSIPTNRFGIVSERLALLRNTPIRGIADVINLLMPNIRKAGYTLYQACPLRELSQLEGLVDAVHVDAKTISKLEELRQSCSVVEWSHSGLNLDSKNTFGILLDGNMIAAAHYLVFPGRLASLGVLTHPEYRIRGFAYSVALAAARHALDCGLTIHYQTLLENTAAIGLSRKLGFGQFGLSCRLELK